MDYREMMKNLEDVGFKRHFPIFDHHTERFGGALPDEKGAHAAWYYCLCAHGMFKDIREGAQYEGEHDHQNMLNNLIRSVAALYQLDSPNEVLKYMIHARLEALRLELEWDDRVEKPYLVKYLGKSH